MKVKINKYTYEIIETKADDLAVRDDKGNLCFGLTNYLSHKIFLLKDVSKARLKATLIHELTHAFIEAYGFVYNETLNNEQVCEFVALYGADIIKIADKYISQR